MKIIVLRSVLVIAALLMPLVLMTGKSVTHDEMVHISAGYSYLKTGRIVLNPMHPPLIKEICALPLLALNPPLPADGPTITEQGKNLLYQWKFGDDFFSNVDVERVLFWSRLPAVLLSVALAVLILCWATELWGAAGGILALSCYVFDPTIVAHAQLVTTDVGFAFFAALLMYSLRVFLKSPSSGRAVGVGVTLGLALAAKFTAVVMIAAAGLIAAFRVWRAGPRDVDSSLRRRVVVAIKSSSEIVLVAGVVIWATYFFTPDPFFYRHGIQSIYGDRNPAYYHFFLGEFRKASWPSYFLVAWLIKTPLPVLLLFAAAVVEFARGPRRGWLDEAALIVPALSLFAATAVFADPLGVRYLIPCFPFLYVFIGRLGTRLAATRTKMRRAVALLVIWQIVEFAAIWPDHLSYFNEVAGGWRGGVAWLDDSNVDWGQGFIELRDYLARHPRPNARLCNFVTPFNAAHYGLDATLITSDDALAPPGPGTWILSSHCVARVRAWLNSYYGDRPENWMARTQPSAIVGHVYYIYDIPG